MIKAKLETYGKDEEHRVWSVKGDGYDLTAVISYKYQDRQRVSFVMHHATREAVIIDNGEWDLLCFDLEYDRNEVWVACENFLEFVKENHEVYKTDSYEFKDYDDLMAVLS